jgi:hypothetical protein
VRSYQEQAINPSQPKECPAPTNSHVINDENP